MWLGDTKNVLVLATAFFYIVSAVPIKCTQNKLIGYILRTWILKNSMNFKILKHSFVTFITFYLKWQLYSPKMF